MKKKEFVIHAKEIHFREKEWINACLALLIVNGKVLMEKQAKVVFVNININGIVNKLNV